MFKSFREALSGVEFLRVHDNGGRGKPFAATIPVAENVTVTTTNPKTFARLTGQAVEQSKPRRRKDNRPGAKPRNVRTARA